MREVFLLRWIDEINRAENDLDFKIYVQAYTKEECIGLTRSFLISS